jgi:hypothetical protein
MSPWSPLKAYIIDINGVGTWWNYVDSTHIAQAAKTLFEANGFEVEIVSDFTRLDSLVNNPPDNVIVINTHGEIMPMSPSWPYWATYFTRLGNNVKNHGWIFVSTLGYPFYYYDQGSGRVGVGGSGVNTFLSVVPGLQVSCRLTSHWDPLYGAYLTKEGGEAASRMGTSLPSRIITVRPAKWSVVPDYVFYIQIDDPWAQEGFKYGASAVSIGKGFFVLNGFGGRNVDLPPSVPPYDNEIIGRAAAAFSAYIARPVIPASIDIDPDTLNLQSRGRWITAYIELPSGYNVEDIDVGTVRLIVENENVPAEPWPVEVGDHDNNGIPDLMVKFDRQAVQALLDVGVHELLITGEVEGTPFEGSDNLRVIDMGMDSLYSVKLRLAENLELRLRFSTYDGEHQAEVLVEPDGKRRVICISHPEGKPVELIELVLAEENRALASLVVTGDDLWDRIVAILGYWAEAAAEEKGELFAEIIDILGQWPEAP